MTNATEPPVYIDRSKIIAVLRAGGLPARASWVEREMPDHVDVRKNRSLLQMLGIDTAAMQSAEAGPGRTVPSATSNMPTTRTVPTDEEAR